MWWDPWRPIQRAASGVVNAVKTTAGAAALFTARAAQSVADAGIPIVSAVAGQTAGIMGQAAAAGLPNPIVWKREASWDLFAFNYDATTRQAVRPRIVLASTATKSGSAVELSASWGNSSMQSRSGTSAELACENCYAHLTAGLRFVLDLQVMAAAPYAQINHLLAEVWGALEVNADLVATVRAAVNAGFEWISPRLGGGALEAVMGRVPISIKADLALSLGATLSARATGTASVGFDYQYQIRQGVEYRATWDGMRPVPSPPSRGFKMHPLKVNIAGGANVEVQVRPIIYLILFGSSNVTLTPSPYIGVDLRFAAQAGARTAAAVVEYDMYYGMGMRLALEKIGIKIPLIGLEFAFKGRFLPWETSLEILNKTYPGTSWSRGRLTLAGSLGASNGGTSSRGVSRSVTRSGATGAASSPSSAGTSSSSANAVTFAYVVGEWGTCSQPCGVGFQSRAVSCVLQDTVTQAQRSVALPLCLIPLGFPPPLIQLCNTQACTGSAACPAACTATNPGNCPASGCDAAACEGLPCYWAQLAAAGCGAATSCADCITACTPCGWCADTSKCMPGSGLLPDAPGVCSAAGWQVTTCSAPEPQLTVLSPSPGSTLMAGQSVAVQWTGGPPTSGQVQLSLRCDNANTSFAGYGLPGSGISNTNSYQWRVAAGIPTSSQCQMVVTSLVDPTNFGLTDGFFGVDGFLAAAAWSAGTWSNCTRVCGGGTRSRSVQCRDLRSGLVVAGSACNAAMQPSTSEACNAIPCANQCPAQLIASGWTWEPCRCLRQNDNKGFFCGTVLTNTATGATQRTGCDTRGSDYQYCCRQQG
jgi:hypothetical protein